MQRKPLRLISDLLAMGLAAVLVLVMAPCSATASSTTTFPPATTTALTAASTAVTTPTLSSIAAAPNPPAGLTAGSARQLTATGYCPDGQTNYIGSQGTGNSSNPGVAAISAAGLITGAAAGITPIVAS